jgi:protein-S-isoprenylcysteine O-methyltransferase Ste14
MESYDPEHVLIVPFIPVSLWGLLDEERVLRRDLTGYIEYTQKVRYRLIPHVW